MKNLNLFIFLSFPVLMGLLCSCSKTESYSELLRDEEHAVNWWLAQRRVVTEIPADSVFEVGAGAPFYKMDEEGNVYMQVINPGSRTNRPKKDDKVYFRFMRTNIKNLYDGYQSVPEGNANDLAVTAATSFIYGNNSMQSTLQYGTGVQIPMDYLGYDCEVNLVIKAYVGFAEEQSYCIPYLMNIRYFKAEY